MNMEYSDRDADVLSTIEELWNKLNKLHSDLSPYYSGEYRKKNFSRRKSELLEKSKNGIMRVFIARDSGFGSIVGYCVCSLVNGIGEIDSIFVDGPYRKFSIGHELMMKADAFFTSNGAEKQILSVYCGNERVIEFYNRYNYYPKYIILEKAGSLP